MRIPLLFLVTFLPLACPNLSSETGGTSEETREDGCFSEVPSVYPGPRSSDGLDNDCDGEKVAGALPTWYWDGDGDGFGDLATPMYACTTPVGWVADATDCHNHQNQVYPRALEADEPDDENALTWYRDGDGDGFGDGVFRCSPARKPLASWPTTPTAMTPTPRSGLVRPSPAAGRRRLRRRSEGHPSKHRGASQWPGHGL